jgi:glycosyltransferase involved in cell wall biosynthesis
MFLNGIMKTTGITALGAIIASEIVENSMKQYDTNVYEPVDTVSIVAPSFNEERFVGTALSSIRHQSIIEKYPEYFEILLIDSGSTDNTVNFAKPYINKIVQSPKGKLTARNLAADYAKGNIIVAIDTDTYYPYHFLNTLLEPFNNLDNPKYRNLVGVFGSTFDYTNIPGKLFSLGDFLYNKLISMNRMTGRNSAFYKHAFYLANRFNESVNQMSLWPLFEEEEKLFGNRLSKLGKIVYKLNASCYHLGGDKSIGRLIGNKDFKDKMGFGKERF